MITYKIHYLALVYLVLTSPCFPCYTLVILDWSYFLNSCHNNSHAFASVHAVPLATLHDPTLISTTAPLDSFCSFVIYSFSIVAVPTGHCPDPSFAPSWFLDLPLLIKSLSVKKKKSDKLTYTQFSMTDHLLTLLSPSREGCQI